MKRMMSFLLAATMLVTLGACGSAPESTDFSGASGGESSSTPEAVLPVEDMETESVETQEFVKAASDASAEESSAESETPAVLGSLSYPLTEEPAELTMWAPGPNLGPLSAWGGDYGVNIMEDYASIQAAAERTGVSIAFENANSMEGATLFSLHIAAGDWADMLSYVDNYYAGGVSRAYEEDVVMDLSDYMETAAPDYMNTVNASELLSKATRTDDGKMLQVCTVYDEFRQAEGSIIRTDWLEKVGMEVPTTIDELHEVLMAFQNELGCTNPFYFNSACNQLLTSFNLDFIQNLSGSDLAIYQVDGTAYSSFATDSYKAWLETMSQWYAEGLIDPDFISVAATNNGGHDEELIAADDVGVWWGHANSISNYYAMSPAEDFAVTGVYFSESGDGVNHVVGDSLPMASNSGITGVSVSAACEDVELALGWLNFWYTEDGIMLMNYGVEGDSYHLVDGEVHYTDVITQSEYNIPAAVALLLYSCAGAPYGVQIQSRTYGFYEHDEMTAINNWSDACDGAWVYPATALSAEESEILNHYAADICTYISESVPRFIMGEYNLAADWETYINTLSQMGLDACVGAYQSSLDRFNARG